MLMARSRTFSAGALLIALLGLLIPQHTTAANDFIRLTAEDVLMECLLEIEELVAETDQELADRTVIVLTEIERLRDDDRPQKKIKKTGKSGKKFLSYAARDGLAELNRITGSCMIHMRRLGSDRELNNALLNARRAALQHMKAELKLKAVEIDQAVAQL